MKKRILLFVVSVIIIGSLPLLINWLILRPQLFNIAADGSTWLLFWASYIGAVASFAMVVTAWYTLKESRRQNDELLTQNEILIQQNKQQLEELKRQWEESHRPRLLFSIISHSGNYFLKICNIGKEAARNVTVSFSENFIENLLFKGTAMRLRQLETPFCIEPQSSKYYFIAPCKSTGKTISCDQESCTSEVANSWLEQHIADSNIRSIIDLSNAEGSQKGIIRAGGNTYNVTVSENGKVNVSFKGGWFNFLRKDSLQRMQAHMQTDYDNFKASYAASTTRKPAASTEDDLYSPAMKTARDATGAVGHGIEVDNKVIKGALDAKANSADLATVATSGSYNDLSDKPTIPSISGLQTQTITDAGGYFTTDTVEAALQQLGAELDGVATLLAAI